VRSILSAALVVGSALFAATSSRADVGPPPPPHLIVAKSDVVFVGKVESIGEKSMRVVVNDVLKGRPGDAVTLSPILEWPCTGPPEGVR